jgi:hypothetical protein
MSGAWPGYAKVSDLTSSASVALAASAATSSATPPALMLPLPLRGRADSSLAEVRCGGIRAGSEGGGGEEMAVRGR